jgi:hypothetical protein
MSAYGATCAIYGGTAFAYRINNWGVQASSGITLSAGAFALTSGKTYLFNVSVSPQTLAGAGQVAWAVFRTDTSARISCAAGHSLAVTNPVNNTGDNTISFVYTAPANLSVAICGGPGTQGTFFPEYSSITITEL